MAAVLAGALPGTAVAQLPDLPPLPRLPPAGGAPRPPSGGTRQPPRESAGGPFGDVVSYRLNPQHTGYTGDDSAFGPLFKLWSRDLGGAVSQPLVVRGLAIANVANDSTSYGSWVVALDLATGHRVWSRATPGTYFSAHIAIDRGRVVALNTDGVMRAFAVRNGRPLWTFRAGKEFSHDSIPVAAGGTAYFVTEHHLYAVAMRTGALRWRRAVPVDYSRAQPALDGRRVYALDTCGRVVAFRRSDGAQLWRQVPDTSCTYGSPGLLLGGRLFTSGSDGFKYDSATGAYRGRLPGGAPDAAMGDTGFARWRRGPVRALSLEDGTTRWKRGGGDSGYGESLRPIVSRATVYVATSGNELLGLDRVDGGLLSIAKLPYEIYSSVGGIEPGIAAGHGVVVATGGARLTAFASVLRPKRRGTDVAASDFDLTWGKTTYFVGGLGSALRHERAVRRLRLQADVYPFKRFATADRVRTLRNGTAFFGGRLELNTRVRVDVAGRRGRARSITIYVYPHKHARWRALGSDRIQVRVTMRAGRRLRLGGHSLLVYWRPHGSSHARRIGSGTMHQVGRGKARGVAVAPRPAGEHRHDLYYWCVTKVRGYGRPDRLTQHCGANSIRP